MSSRLFGCSIRLLAQCRLFLLRLSMDRLSLPRLVCSILRVGADTVVFGVCMSLEVHRFVSVFFVLCFLYLLSAHRRSRCAMNRYVCASVLHRHFISSSCVYLSARWRRFAALRFVCANDYYTNYRKFRNLSKL